MSSKGGTLNGDDEHEAHATAWRRSSLGTEAAELAGRWLTALGTSGDQTGLTPFAGALLQLLRRGTSAALAGTVRSWALRHSSVESMLRELSVLRRLLDSRGRYGTAEVDAAVDHVMVLAIGAFTSRLTAEARTDVLTGVGNRRGFEEAAERTLALAARHGHEVSVVVVDVDGLKAINDSLGHQAGDDHLKALADALRAEVRAEDELFRIGGDEFAVVMPFCSAHGAAESLERVREAGAPRFSFGVAAFPVDGLDVATLVAQADLTMYGTRRRRRGAKGTTIVPLWRRAAASSKGGLLGSTGGRLGTTGGRLGVVGAGAAVVALGSGMAVAATVSYQALSASPAPIASNPPAPPGSSGPTGLEASRPVTARGDVPEVGPRPPSTAASSGGSSTAGPSTTGRSTAGLGNSGTKGSPRSGAELLSSVSSGARTASGASVPGAPASVPAAPVPAISGPAGSAVAASTPAPSAASSGGTPSGGTPSGGSSSSGGVVGVVTGTVGTVTNTVGGLLGAL